MLPSPRPSGEPASCDGPPWDWPRAKDWVRYEGEYEMLLWRRGFLPSEPARLSGEGLVGWLEDGVLEDGVKEPSVNDLGSGEVATGEGGVDRMLDPGARDSCFRWRRGVEVDEKEGPP